MNSYNSYTSAVFKNMLNWFYENESKVYLVFETSDPEVTATPGLPQQYIKNSKIANQEGQEIGEISNITMNLGPDAIDKFEYFGEGFSFTVRFNTVPCVIYVPYTAVISLHNPDKNGKVWTADYMPSFGRTQVVKKEEAVEEQPKPVARPSFLQRVK